ncbi:MAG TPA: hypothetical protein VGD77_05300 [Gemmatimonadaceae bacterium]
MGEQDVVQEISSLVEERRRFEQWIVALDARRATTPPHVFDRVRADYTARLQGVLARLDDFMPRLRELEAGLIARLEAAHGAIREVEDHRAESELRAHVGELSAADWTQVQEDSATRLSALGDELQGIERELASVRDLMSGGTPPGSPAVPALPEPSVSYDTEVRAAPAMVADAVAPARSEPEPDPEPEPEPEPVPLVEDYVLPEAPPPAATAPKPVITDSLPWLDPIPYKDSSSHPIVADDSPMPEAPAAPAPEPARLSGAVERPVDDSLGIFVQGSATDDLLPTQRTSKETPLASHVSSNNPMVLKSEGPATKTLKCSECGSMNVPTEWYCERCGAELAAL